MSPTIAAAMVDESTQALQNRRDELRRRSRPLSGGEPEPLAAELERVAAWCREYDIAADSYGDGADLQAFETRVAEMLGFEAARFMPSGTMAQQIAARIWSGRCGRPLIGMHPTCHLELHEERGYDRLHGLSVVFIGESERPMIAADLLAIAEPMAALIVELPTRENGGRLAPWDDLVELCGTARERGIAVHLDGARLWEAATGYERPLDEVARLFDSAYVSFYKGIGALPGSMLLGRADFIAEARIWQRRSGGILNNMMANWASAAMRLDDRLEKMPRYRDRAREVAAALAGIDGITINPDPPEVNMFHVFVAGDREALLLARDAIAGDRGLWLHGALLPSDVPNVHRFEVAIGDGALAADLDEVTASFEELLRLAEGGTASASDPD